MDKRIVRTGMVLTTALSLSLGVLSQAQTQGTSGPWTEILSPQREVRQRASQEVSRRNGEIANGLSANVTALTAQPEGVSHDFQGPFHLTVVTIANVRAEPAAMRLLPMIDFRLDPATLPSGARAGASAYYPVAETLARVGGQKVINGVLAQLVLPRSDEFVRASSWVLHRTLGSEVALLLVGQRLDRTSTTLLKLGKTGNPETENLQRVMQLIKTGGVILPLIRR